MSFGAGLAGFVSGLESGMKMRDRYDERKKQREFDTKQKELNEETRAAFADARAAGAVEEHDFGRFWLNYALPRQQALLLEKGDYKGAHALGEWGRSEDAIKGGQLFGSALIKANTGDFDGAIQDAIAAGSLKGYINTDMQLTNREPIVHKGRTVGYRLHVKDGNGETKTHDVRIEDVPKLIGTYANPENAFKSQLDAQAAENKRKQDLENYRDKKVIDKEFSEDKTADKQSNRYQKAQADRAKNDLNWNRLSPEEQDKLVRQDLEAADRYGAEKTGGGDADSRAIAPGLDQAPQKPSRFIVDTKEGKPITSRDQGNAVGLPKPPSVAPDEEKPWYAR